MNMYFRFVLMLAIVLFSYTPQGLAQTDVADEPNSGESPTENTDTPAGQEVEINEDNYRQFMELRDARQRRNAFPENAFKPKSGLQKLDDLPEASQKHLRNQLREIIVQGDEWQPGDEGSVYPYVPSDAAETDHSLQNQEAEAWGELVDSYHKREAEIYDNAARSQAAMASEGSPGDGSGNGENSAGEKSGQGEGGMAEQAGEQRRSVQESEAGGYSPNASNDPNANSTAGVSQNAMEFLKGQMNQGGANAGAGSSDTPPGSSGQASSQAQTQASGKSGQEQNRTAGTSPGATNEPQPNSTEGVSQSAMEFLSQSGNQMSNANENGSGSANGKEGQANGQAQEGDQSGEEQNRTASSTAANASSSSASDSETSSTEGVSQNAMEFLLQDGNQDANEGLSNDASLADTEGQGSAQGDGQAENGEENAEELNSDADTSLASTSETSDDEAEGESTTGTSQNALEYLMGETRQPGQAESDRQAPRGTLTIQDLLNAQGTLNAGSSSTVVNPEQPDKNKPEKDGGN